MHWLCAEIAGRCHRDQFAWGMAETCNLLTHAACQHWPPTLIPKAHESSGKERARARASRSKPASMGSASGGGALGPLPLTPQPNSSSNPKPPHHTLNPP